MFNKTEYWKNRKAGKRGQGDDTPATVTKTNGASTRKRDRKRLVNRDMTRKGFVYGTRIGTRVHNSIITAQKRFMNEQFSDKKITSKTLMSKDKPDQKAKENVVYKYMFNFKSKHTRSETEEMQRHRKNVPTPTQDPDIKNKDRVAASRLAHKNGLGKSRG